MYDSWLNTTAYKYKRKKAHWITPKAYLQAWQKETIQFRITLTTSLKIYLQWHYLNTEQIHVTHSQTNRLLVTKNSIFLQIITHVIVWLVHITECAKQPVQPLIRAFAFHVLLTNPNRFATTKESPIKVSVNTNSKSAKTRKNPESSIMEAANVSVGHLIKLVTTQHWTPKIFRHASPWLTVSNAPS